MPKFIIHSGLPKTGTTAFQHYCYANRDNLLKSGLFYDNHVHSSLDPKHQWIIQSLRTPELFDTMDLSRFKRPDKAHTVLLSTESITNELPLLKQEATKRFTNTLSRFGELKFLIVTRDPASWTLSYYRQAVINQPVRRLNFYSTSLLYSDFCALDHIKALTNKSALNEHFTALFSKSVQFVEYGPQVLSDILSHCNYIPQQGKKDQPQANSSVNDAAVEFMRQLNSVITDLNQKCAWAKVFITAQPTSSSALNILARRAKKVDIYNLSVSTLNNLAFVDNPPLHYTFDDFENLRMLLTKTLIKLQSD